MSSTSPSPVLLAAYSAPFNEPKTFTHSLPPHSNDPPTSERTSYLTELRKSVTTVQDQINVFLTRKMEEDIQKAGVAEAVDDAKEEENYGEEVVDGDGWN